MSLLTSNTSGKSSYTLPIIFTSATPAGGVILLNGGGVVQIADSDFASYSSANGDIEITQNGKYRITFNAYAKVTMAHTSNFGNFYFVCGTTNVFGISKLYTANTFAENTLPLWFWYNRATSTLARTSPAAVANAGYNFEGTLMKTHEQVMTKGQKIYLACQVLTGTFSGAFDGFITVEQIA